MGQYVVKTLLCGLVLFSQVCFSNEVTKTQVQQLSTTEKLYGLSLFWKEVKDNFAFFHQVPELDWDQAYRDAIPKVIATQTTFDYYRELQKLNKLLTSKPLLFKIFIIAIPKTIIAG